MSGRPTDRIAARFALARAEARAALVGFVTAGDPDYATSEALIAGLLGAGVDVLELGMPFSDPVADGPTIQAAGERALAGGATLGGCLGLVERLRARDSGTPIVLMGYYNPIHAYGPERFARDAAAAGVDGLIVVDLPPEEEAPLREPAREAGLHLIRLITPTTDATRLERLLEDASGFLYYVSIAGITGTRAPDLDALDARIGELKARAALPVAVGFGIRTPDQAAAVARFADGVVVGSAIVEALAEGLEGAARDRKGAIRAAVDLAHALAQSVRGARIREQA